MNARTIVFLDFDDVISVSDYYKGSAVVLAFRKNDLDYNPDLWSKIFDSILCANLRTLHDEFEPRYVISSSWASLLERDQIVELFKRTGLQFVASNLHEEWRTPRTPETERVEEIARWLAAHNAAAPAAFVILDDFLSGKSLQRSPLEANAVLCDAWKGFKYPKLRTAQKILRTQLATIDERTRRE